MDSTKVDTQREHSYKWDDERAVLIDEILKLSSEMVEFIRDSKGHWAAERICEMLLPYTDADAVSVTDRERVLAYKGYLQENYPQNCKIRTKSTKEVLKDGWARTLLTKEDIGFPEAEEQINAAIVEPIIVSKVPVGVLKFYYRDAKRVTESQQSIAHGFARLIATQITASEVEYQKELSTAMELKMLQSQINPHFLFNTISTISSFTRTDTEKARKMLRQFASFYRSTLDQDNDFVTIQQEIDNVEKYVSLQQARFGEDKLAFNVVADKDITTRFSIPPFCLQPVVENSIKHAMVSDKCLNIQIKVSVTDRYVTIKVKDDGRGMSEEVLNSLFKKTDRPAESASTSAPFDIIDRDVKGLGLAMNNVYERLKLSFRDHGCVSATSEVGRGTTTVFKIPVDS